MLCHADSTMNKLYSINPLSHGRKTVAEKTGSFICRLLASKTPEYFLPLPKTVGFFVNSNS
jgi:hypothetical protein